MQHRNREAHIDQIIILFLLWIGVWGCSAHKQNAISDETALLEDELHKLGSYSAEFDPKDVARSHNIAIAAAALDGAIIKPGDVFSYNERVGPRTVERGYKIALTLHLTGAYPDIGGGVCQVSSVLYNAALLADMQITERYPHSRLVHYIPAGRDATVNYGTKDVKFKNPLAFPVILKSAVTHSRVTIEMYGPRQLPYEVVLKVGDREIENNIKPLQIEEEQVGHNKRYRGLRINLYRLRLKEGTVVEKEKIAGSYYPL